MDLNGIKYISWQACLHVHISHHGRSLLHDHCLLADISHYDRSLLHDHCLLADISHYDRSLLHDHCLLTDIFPTILIDPMKTSYSSRRTNCMRYDRCFIYTTGQGESDGRQLYKEFNTGLSVPDNSHIA